MDPYPKLPLSESQIAELVEKGKDWAVSNGMVMRRVDSTSSSDVVTFAPFTLLPSPFPKDLYEQAQEVQNDLSLLYFRAAKDYDFISTSLGSVVKTDAFTRRLLEIYTVVQKEGLAQTRVLQIQRSDYMAHSPSPQTFALKQIEVNNIASSFSALAAQCTRLHHYLLRELDPQTDAHKMLPSNDGLGTVGTGLASAFAAYKAAYSGSEPVILHVIEEANQNISDQRWVEYATLDASGGDAHALRLSLGACRRELHLEPKTKVLRHEPTGAEVGVVYFRAGYVPTQMVGEDEWAARLLIERSRAIKSPWIGLHLAGSKKVQQTLAAPEVVEKFLFDKSEEAVSRVRATFAGLWGLEADAHDTQAAVDNAIAQPDRFVLKPQLEGGGNNLYGEEMAAFLRRAGAAEREAYILMERLSPHSCKNYLLFPRGEAAAEVETISELGVYGVLLGDYAANEVLFTKTGGHNFRTKSAETDEGGVMAGASALDSPFLF